MYQIPQIARANRNHGECYSQGDPGGGGGGFGAKSFGHWVPPLFFYMLCLLRGGGTSSMSDNALYDKFLEVIPKSCR
jgi:hypothetical protein